MKINENELSFELQQKLNSLTEYMELSKKKAEVCAVDKVENPIISDNEIRDILSHFYKSEDGYESAFNSPLINSVVFSNNVPSFIVPLVEKFEFKTEGNVIRQKIYPACIVVMDDQGILYKVDKASTIVQSKINVLKILKTNFIQKNFSLKSILDFELYKDGVLVSTEYNGVYYLSPQTKQYELKFPIYPVSIIKVLDTHNILCCTNTELNSINIFDFDTGKKVTVFNNLKKNGTQLPHSVIVNDKNFYVLGRSYSVNQSGNLLHWFAYNSDDGHYENYDYKIHKHKEDNEYQVKFFTEDLSNLYIAGITNGALFIWKYNKKFLHMAPVEIIFNKIPISYDELEGFVVKNNKVFIVINKRILSFDIDTLAIENNFSDLAYSLENQTCDYYTDKIYGYRNNEIYSSTIPIRKHYEELQIDILRNSKTSNNITICMKSNNGKERAAFIDPSSLNQINPSYYMIINNSISVIKFVDKEIHNLLMKLKVPADTVIDMLVINENRLYYK